jgi:uncharacterized protein YndB with AHSA1/START domain
MNTSSNAITVQTSIAAPIEKVWDMWTKPEHIIQWNNASDDWHTPHAENDLQAGGKFLSRMAAKDGSMSFDFEGVYELVQLHQNIKYVMSDGRRVSISFSNNGSETQVTEIFDPENENPAEMQRAGWQAIIDNFKKYVEQN